MKWLKSFKNFKESLIIDLQFSQIDLMESLNILHDVLLSSISAEKMDFIETLKLSKEFSDKLDIELLNDNIEFINSLSSIGLKKSPIQQTDDHQTFINKPFKWMFLYDFNSSELENPEYIIFQIWNETLQKWEEANLYKVGDNVKKFYDKLSSRTIEIVDGEKNYIYTTSNGNDWEIQNIDSENDTFKRFLTKEELQKILDQKNVTLNII